MGPRAPPAIARGREIAAEEVLRDAARVARESMRAGADAPITKDVEQWAVVELFVRRSGAGATPMIRIAEAVIPIPTALIPVAAIRIPAVHLIPANIPIPVAASQIQMIPTPRAVHPKTVWMRCWTTRIEQQTNT